jgi:hypothetical protein
MTYTEKRTELLSTASVAVWVLINEQRDDVELLPLLPRQYSENEVASLVASWQLERGLRPIGVMGLVGTVPRCEFKASLEAKVVLALASAFTVYLQTLFQESFAAQFEGFEIAELCRLWQMEDPRQ